VTGRTPNAPRTEAPEILLLAPSTGAGGGIERYLEAMVEALTDSGASVHTIAVVNGSGALATSGNKVRFSIRAAAAALRVGRTGRPTQIIVAHPSLAPFAPALRVLAGSPTRPFLLLYGQEVWVPGQALRWLVRARLLEMVAISDFTAGAVVGLGNARILPPGVSNNWFSRLTQVADTRERRSPGSLRVLTVVRLAEAAKKGVLELAAAVAALRVEGRQVELIIAGSGRLPADIATVAHSLSGGCTVRTSLSDEELAVLYSSVDVVVLATRLSARRRDRSGEGFGFVLVEAQLAGAMVIGPAFGGSAGAYLEGVSGLRPRNESSGELVRLLRWCDGHREEIASMGSAGQQWTQTRFSPNVYRQSVLATLDLGSMFDTTLRSGTVTVSDSTSEQS
jgi:phosphatidylinositol alpha-1,6-mannosyltransferase